MGATEEAQRRYKGLMRGKPTAIGVINYADFVCDRTKDRRCTLAIYEIALAKGIMDPCVMARFIDARLILDHKDANTRNGDLQPLAAILANIDLTKNASDKMATLEIHFVSALDDGDMALKDSHVGALIGMLKHEARSLI